MDKFPASVPRKMLWSTEVGGTSICPRCGAQLEKEHHTYVMAVRERGDIQPFVVGNEAGHFCSKCPTVVLDWDEFNDLAGLCIQSSQAAFVVMGLVDLDAIPAGKANVPLADDDNPIPLVKFTNITGANSPAASKRKRRDRTKGKKRKKRKRR